jgi:hypothetical protein
MTYYLSYLIGAEKITDKDLTDLDIIIDEKKSDGDRTLKIEDKRLPEYMDLIRRKLTPGFWNEMVGEKEIIFIFKFKDGKIKEFSLSPKNEDELSVLCAEFNDQSVEEMKNIYKFLSGVSFYRDFMYENYAHEINR